MYFQLWADMVRQAVESVGYEVANFIPNLIGAVIIFLLGLIVASALGTLAGKIVSVFKIDNAFRQFGIEKYFERGGVRLHTALFIDRVIFWLVTIVALLAATNILGLDPLSYFLEDVLAYIPNVIVAVLMILVAIVLANLVEKVVRGSVLSARLNAAKFLGALSWYTILIFGFLQALYQLLPPEQLYLISMVMTGLVAMIAIAGGIAFGIGGKDYAAHLIGKFRDRVED